MSLVSVVRQSCLQTFKLRSKKVGEAASSRAIKVSVEASQVRKSPSVNAGGISSLAPVSWDDLWPRTRTFVLFDLGLGHGVPPFRPFRARQVVDGGVLLAGEHQLGRGAFRRNDLFLSQDAERRVDRSVQAFVGRP